MPLRPKPGTKQTNIELPIELLEQAKKFAKERGEVFVNVVCAALRRHMANPPPLPHEIPLPPAVEEMPAAKKPRKAKS